MQNALYVSTEDDTTGTDTVERATPYGSMTVRVGHWIREHGTGAPIPTAGGQRDSRRVAGPFATRGEAEAALVGLCSSVS